MTKRVGLTLGLLILLACATFVPSRSAAGKPFVIHAQTLPITRTLAWDQTDAVTSGVTGYRVVLDAAAPILVGVCSPTPIACGQLVTFTTAGAHTLSVTAVNVWGDSVAAVLAVNIVVANKSTNLTIKAP